jgi:hypothetical protein
LYTSKKKKEKKKEANKTERKNFTFFFSFLKLKLKKEKRKKFNWPPTKEHRVLAPSPLPSGRALATPDEHRG